MITTLDTNGLFKIDRGPRPTRGEIFRYDSDINLEEGWFEFFHGEVRQEERWCRETGCRYFHRPLSDFSRPTPRELLDIVELMYDRLKVGNVLVHCARGEDRTGLVCAAYRMIRQGWSYNHAVDEMLRMGFHEFPYGWWKESLLVIEGL